MILSGAKPYVCMIYRENMNFFTKTHAAVSTITHINNFPLKLVQIQTIFKVQEIYIVNMSFSLTVNTATKTPHRNRPWISQDSVQRNGIWSKHEFLPEVIQSIHHGLHKKPNIGIAQEHRQATVQRHELYVNMKFTPKSWRISTLYG